MLELYKPVMVSHAVKKSIVERCTFTKDGKHVAFEALWRGGSWKVTPQNEDEINYLLGGLDGDEIEMDYFQEQEVWEYYDEISRDWDCCELVTDEELEDLMTGFEEDGYIFFEENDWTEQPVELTIYNGIEIEECE